MISVQFRFLGPDGKPTGWVGFAFARNKIDLFRQIDNFGDPYCVQIRPLAEGAVCLEKQPAPEGKYCERVISSGGIYDMEEDGIPDPAFDEDGWKKIKWPAYATLI